MLILQQMLILLARQEQRQCHEKTTSRLKYTFIYGMNCHEMTAAIEGVMAGGSIVRGGVGAKMTYPVAIVWCWIPVGIP